MNLNCNPAAPVVCTEPGVRWKSLAALPDSTGFAGSFAGVADGALVVAGGANFPNGGAPWKGSQKKWYDQVFILEQPGGNWKDAGRLPVPSGYGVSITTPDGLLLVGGSNEKGHLDGVWRLHYRDRHLSADTLPSLPFPLANACGALLDSIIYVAGGLLSPDSQNTQPVFLSLDLSRSDAGWQSLPAWPGPSRMLAVAGTAAGKFYLFSGTELKNGQRQYLKDAYAYEPGKGWLTLPPLPRAAVAAPTPAWLSPDNELLIFGGDDGVLASGNKEWRELHPGFSREILGYAISEPGWRPAGVMPVDKQEDSVTHPNRSIWAPVTTPLVSWSGLIVFPGGEVRPATRTPNVLAAGPCRPETRKE